MTRGTATAMRARAGRGAAIVVAAVLLAGCAAPAPGGQADDGAASGEWFDDPVPFALDRDFPDPDVLQVGDTYYAFATNAPGINIQVASSSDLESWEPLAADALPDLPAWATEGRTWAPEVTELSPGRFVMYATMWHTDPSAQCIGVAVADDPAGPYVPVGDAPIVCPIDDGGAIDATTYVDDAGGAHLLFKNDGNCCDLPTWLQIAPLTPDGTQLAGEPVKLLEQDQDWEGILIEAPTLVRHDDSFVLFYSANDYGGDRYAMGYATSADLLGPYVKADGPLMTTETASGRFLGPGGQDVVVGPDGEDRLVFHSWDAAYIKRGMNVIALDWEGDTPVPVMPD